ncbi:hypothetical protein MRB53_008387 [Persea americana]|uniref:Uncharacterized protein n=1 Tax=Persea americana TaxID=3435 RepID=A0ACC2MLZ2_PERAE|nr:hypothetical protein MRB53_008387 [Persea americana]
MAQIPSIFSSSFLLLLLVLASPSINVAQHPTFNLSPSDLQALLQIKTDLTDLPGSDFLSTWDISSSDPCASFAGVFCAPDPDPTSPALLRVSSLTLGTGLADSPGLGGSLSPAIANLTGLAQLVVHPGHISGPIPSQIGNLHRLIFLSMTNNLISGPIPDSLSALPSLHTLDLGHNRIFGPIPPDITQMPSLKVLILASNRISGRVPPIQSQLLHLDLRSNALSGTLPPLPSSLRYLSASDNGMWGPLDSVGSLPDLGFLDLGMNEFSGGLPEGLFVGRVGMVLLLERNNLSGGIPAGGGGVGMLGSTVDLSHNLLSGELPAVLAGAESLYLNNNRFTGAVPVEYVRSVYLGGTKTLYLQHNYLSGFPLPFGSPLPASGALCISYNCMVPPVGATSCPSSAGDQMSRPAGQCSSFNGTNSNG